MHYGELAESTKFHMH